MKKRILAVMLAMAVLGTLTACGNENAAERENTNAEVGRNESSS